MDSKERHQQTKTTIEDYAIVNPEGKPNSAILQMMNILELPHDGTLKSVVEITQEKFFQKKPDGQRKERWEIQEVVPHLREQAMPILDRLGMLKEIPPSENKYGNVLMLGALVTVVRRRLNYLENLWKNGVRFDRIVFLTGERPLHPERENSSMLLDRDNKELLIREDWQPPKVLPATELEMMQLVWDQGKFPQDMKQVEVLWINAPIKQIPTGGYLRPTTEDTIKMWQETNPKAEKPLAISNNPHIGYQHSVLKTYLPKEFGIETVGAAASLELPLAYYLGEMARWLYQEQIRLQKITPTANTNLVP